MRTARFAPSPGTHGHRVQQALRRGAPPERDVAARYLAGVATFRDRDGARALRLLSDESRRVRGIAFVVAPLACDDAQALAALQVAWSVRGERRLLRRMRARDRLVAIDLFLDGLAAEGHHRDLIDDLPFGTRAAVDRHLAIALERPSARFWDGLALSHPAVLASVLIERWRAVDGEADPVTRQRTARHHARLAERAPDDALALAAELLAHGVEPSAQVFAELLRRRVEETVALAIQHASRLPSGVLAKRVRELSPAILGRIVGHAPHLLGDFGPQVRRMRADQRRALADAWCDASERFPAASAHLLKYIDDDERRERAYQRWTLAARDRDGVIGADEIAALPVALAAREAARHLRDVVALATDPVRRLTGIARYLPWDALEPALRDHLGHPEGAMRALALGELLENPGVHAADPSLPARALERIVARKFEQDPVRHVIFSALARWPRRIFRPEHLPAIAQAIRDGLDAADLSVATAAAMERVVVRLFGVDGAWAAKWLGTLVKERGTIHDANLGGKLSEDDVRAAAPHLLAVAKSWATRERGPWLVAFANGLGAKLRLIDGLSALLVRVRDETAYEWLAIQITDALARHDRATFDATLESALAKYRKRRWWEAAFTLADHYGLTGRAKPRERSRRRPLLPAPLSELLGEIAMHREPRYAPRALALLRGRDPQTFDRVVGEITAADASVIAVPDVKDWIDRHRQDRLEPYLDGTPIRGEWASGNTAWILLFERGFFRWSPTQVERLAKTLETIVHDADRDTPSVFAALEIWPQMEYASMDRLCALASDPRPAVREKAIRVLARCDAGQGVPTLLACLADDRARFAIYGLRRALFGMVGERALALLRGAPMQKVTIAKEVVRLAGELRASGSFPWLEELSQSRLHRDVRIALLRALWDHLDREPTWRIYQHAVVDPDWVVASRLADVPADRLTVALDARLSALLGQVLDRPEPEARIDLLRRASILAIVDRERAFLGACRRRIASPYDDEIVAAVAAVLARSAETDLPAFAETLASREVDPRALHVAARAVVAHDIPGRRSWIEAAAALAEVAMRDPRWSVLAVEAMAARREPAGLLRTLEALADKSALDVDASFAARDAVTKLRDEDLDPFAEATIASERPAVRRVAVWAVAHAARPGRGWTESRRQWLARLRADRSAEVAGAAARVWPPREDDPGFP
jgi:hypothetical protein